MEEKKTGCTVESAAVSSPVEPEAPLEKETRKEVGKMTVMVGKKAPDFTAPAFHKDKFVQVKLSDYLGKWVVLCFYPGDFTFV